MNNPVHNKDTTPLWGGAQYAYPDHAGSPGPSTSWSVDHPPHPMAQHHPFDPYHGMREDINYTELKSEHGSPMSEPDSVLPDAYPRAMAYIQHQQQYQQQQQQQLMAGGGPPIPQENPPYLQSLAAFQENRSSPDLGYSSPPPVPEFFGAQYHQPRGHQIQVAGGSGGGEFSMSSSYHQNVMSSGEQPPMMRHVPVKQESADPPVSYSKQLELIVKHVDENKPIIHANIQICPPYKFGPSSQVQTFPQQQQPQQQAMQPEPAFCVDLTVPQQTPRAEPQQQQQQQQPHNTENENYELMELDQQPDQPASRKPVIVSAPKKTPKKTPAKPKKSPPKKAATPGARRSVRPSGIEHSDFQCLKCGEFFARKCGLTQHDKWIHTQRDHQCITCGKFFPTEELLEKHEIRHGLVDKAFKCDQCEKQYCHKNDLRRHMYRHTLESPFVCELCPAAFGRADHLTAHVNSHERKERMAAEKAAAQREAEEREAAMIEAALREGRPMPRRASRARRN